MDRADSDHTKGPGLDTPPLDLEEVAGEGRRCWEAPGIVEGGLGWSLKVSSNSNHSFCDSPLSW